MFPPQSCSQPPGRSDSLGFCSLVHGPLINFCAAAQPILCTAAPYRPVAGQAGCAQTRLESLLRRSLRQAAVFVRLPQPPNAVGPAGNRAALPPPSSAPPASEPQPLPASELQPPPVGPTRTPPIPLSTMDLPHLEAVGFSCADADATAAFFVDSLGGRLLGDLLEVDGGPYTALIGLPGARLRLRRLALGAEVLELTEVLDPGPGAHPGQPIPADSRSNDRGFQHICLVVNSMEEALAGLRPALDSGRITSISTTPQRLPDWNSAAAGIVAYKFHDPEGHPLELLEFPPDKGDARWHRAGPGPLLGIDHSAIGIADTARSVAFYAQLLGLRHLSDGENSGPEQDGLDGLRGVRVRISALRCQRGPGIECLNYLSPPGGSPLPRNLGPQDAAHWQLRLLLADLETVAKSASAYGGWLISPGIVDLADQAPLFGARWALQLADPDGHRLQLLQTPVQG